MTRRPLPAHGTYARANGSPGYRPPCYCEPCILARRRHKKHNSAMRTLGRPGKVDASQARQRLLLLNQTTGWNDLAAALEASAANLRDIAYGRRNPIRRETHNKIMGLKVRPSAGQYIDATGSRRRIQALRAIGWSVKAIADQAATGSARIQRISTSQPTVRYSLAIKIRDAYDALSRLQPPPGAGTTLAKAHAAMNDYAPPATWDDDTIDDPNAHPEWTGHCGTDRGWWKHKVDAIPACPRCEAAHAAWLAERRDLPAAERFRQLASEKAAASQRGANLAHDARELMRVSGLDYEQAAARLGVTRQHLQQELIRHPETELAA